MIIFITVLCLLLFEAIALAWLYFSVASYKKFWQQQANQPGEITYLALGDSAAQGIGATSPMRGYVGEITKRLEKQTGKKIRVINLSVTGATLKDYLDVQATQLKKVKNPDLVTIEIGANDIKNYNPIVFRKQLKEVLKSLPSGTYIANMPLFNSRPGSTENARKASKVIEQEVKRGSEYIFVDLQKYTTENQSIFGFAPDFFHPNNLSYQNWANAFWDQIEKRIPDGA